MSEANFFLKEPKLKGKTLVYLFFSYNNSRLKYSTGEKIHTQFWNSEDQRAKESKKFPEYPEFNARLINIKTVVNNAYRTIVNDGNEPNNDLLRDILDKKLRYKEEDKKPDLFSFITNYIEESKLLKSPGTISVYNRTLTHLKDYCETNKCTLDFNDIDLEFYNMFVGYLTQLNFSQNTIGKNIKVLKTFLNEATERGINKSLEFKKRKFKRLTEDTDKIYLNTEELERMYKLKIEDKQLDKVRDLFIIGCYTGLRFSDFSELKQENVLEGNKIKIRMNKTNDTVIIPLHKYVREILKKYNNEVPKSLCNQKMNVYIKHIGSTAKIKDKIEVAITKGGKLMKETCFKYNLISTHTARRSFATNLFIADIPAITIMKITGHRTEKSFLRYIRISQEENANKLLNHPFFN